MGFTIVLGCVLSMMAFMAMGYAMAKAKLAKVEHSRTLSAFLVYCATPGMIISSFQNTSTPLWIHLSNARMSITSAA